MTHRIAHRRDAARTQLVAQLTQRAGVARTSTLHRAGISRHVLSEALSEGVVRRVRRGWVALPNADQELVAAARDAVVLTCVTQARRLGLWVLTEDLRHVAAAPHASGGKPMGSRVHWATPLVARDPDALTDPIENILALVAACQPYETALAIWESALRRDAGLHAVLSRLPLAGSAAAVRDAAWIYTDSGLETLFRTRLGWLRVRIIPQAWIHGHRVDFLIGDRLVVQIDGGTHVGPQRTSDIAHDADLLLRGYHVLRFGYHQIVSDWATVQDCIVRAIAQGLHLR